MPHLSWTPNAVVSPQVPFVPPRRILLVDTEANDRERYARYIRERGFAVCACGTYDEGVSSLQGKNFDMVIVDQGSPAFEGELVLEMSVARNRSVPVLVLARHHDMASYVEAMQRGAVDYLEKPITRENLMWTIETHLPSSSGFPSKLPS